MANLHLLKAIISETVHDRM